VRTLNDNGYAPDYFICVGERETDRDKRTWSLLKQLCQSEVVGQVKWWKSKCICSGVDDVADLVPVALVLESLGLEVGMDYFIKESEKGGNENTRGICLRLTYKREYGNIHEIKKQRSRRRRKWEIQKLISELNSTPDTK
jgi:hypothetical protein